MNLKLRVLAEARGGWFSRSDAVRAGYTDAELRIRVRDRQWTRLCRDAYVEPGTWPDDEAPWDRATRLHTILVRVVLARLDPGVAASHHSAALLHGLPGWGVDLTKVHVTRCTGRSRSNLVVRTHRSPLPLDDVASIDGLRLTSAARCVVETACATSYEVGVVLADAVLRNGSATRDELIATADRFDRWRGSPAARAAVRFANPLSESVGESRLRVLMANHGLPEPTPQAEIRDSGGRLLGRADFLVDGHLVVEFDGAQKYSGDAADIVVAEKWREDRIRELGYSFVRVGWADLGRPTVTAARIRRGLARSAARREPPVDGRDADVTTHVPGTPNTE